MAVSGVMGEQDRGLTGRDTASGQYCDLKAVSPARGGHGRRLVDHRQVGLGQLPGLFPGLFQLRGGEPGSGVGQQQLGMLDREVGRKPSRLVEQPFMGEQFLITSGRVALHLDRRQCGDRQHAKRSIGPGEQRSQPFERSGCSPGFW